MIDTIARLERATADLFTDHTHTCVACGASYRTCNPRTGGRCSRCLVGPGSAATDARITCRVCGAQATVPLDHPALLCALCLGNLDQTRARVATWLGSALDRLDANKAAWEADLVASPAADKWPAIQGALIAVAEKRATQAQLDQTWTKRKAEGGALAQLLKNYEIYTAACDQLSEELNKIHAAQTEINAAFLATEV
jgi:hypothetical protein